MRTCSGVVVFGVGALTGREAAYLAHLEGPLPLLLPELFLLSRAVRSVVGAVYCASGHRGGSCPCSSSSPWNWSLWDPVRGSPCLLIFISDPVFSTSFMPVLFSFLSVVCVFL